MKKIKKKITSVNEYIMNLPETSQNILLQIRNVVRELAPNATETISYQIPTFKLAKKNLVHFAAFKNHIGFYPTPSAIEAFRDKLGNYDTSKGSIKFPLNNEIPYDLITEIVRYRVKEILES
ncbi:MAG: DUF1801 domain-containing protein [Candidatus Lokiarchaeota archaeon]|nr:DUF1801 domain-containing protein [Candidatus Lokiarchaeota archaeon]